MKSLLTPKLDLVFKLLLTRDLEILRDLVNAVLASSESRHIQRIEVKNPVILPEELSKMFIILDILAVDEQNRSYDIEMQVQSYASYPKRALYYLSRMYAEQLNSGEDYRRLIPVIGIHFLDYAQFPDQEAWQWYFELRDLRVPQVRLSGDLSLHVFELVKFEQALHAEVWGEKLLEWLHFLNHAHEEGEKMMQKQYTNPAIQRAFNVPETLSAEEETRLRAEMREKALKNEVSMLAAVKEEGREEGREEGLDTGEVIGEIRMLQRVLKRAVSSTEELAAKPLTELREILQLLERELPS